ncbi:unnamed protein product [Lactuca saligna]|uniref:BED-type domain-containing protein n=1 Tax=Lactuca saligna TaxID=75948 RepID=A0AA35Z0M2_LACSI|nr:unnamed protein product [Lactuca saligna]
MERSQLDAQTVDVDARQTVDVDEGDDEEVEDNKGGGHKVSWVWQHFDREDVKKGAKKVKCPYCPTMMCENSKKNVPSQRSEIVAKYVRSSGARFATFQEYVEKVKINCSKKPSLDVDTIWNSTFLKLETAESMRRRLIGFVRLIMVLKLFAEVRLMMVK